MVYAGGSRYDDMGTVSILHRCSALEGHTIFVGRIKPLRRMQITNLSRLESLEGIGAQLYQCFCVCRSATNARTGDIMGVFRQPMTSKPFLSCLYQSGIMGVHIAHKEPSTDTIIRHIRTKLRKRFLITVQQCGGLHSTVAFRMLHSHAPQVGIAVALTDCRSMFLNDFHSSCQIKPERHLTSVKRRLLDNAYGIGLL